MKKSFYLAIAGLGLIITTAIVYAVTNAASGTATTTPLFNQQTVKQAIANNDYNGWKTTMENQVAALRQRADQLQASISQANFDKLVQAYQLIKDGKPDEAKKIFDELGMTSGGCGWPGKGLGFNKGFMRGLHLGQKLHPKQ